MSGTKRTQRKQYARRSCFGKFGYMTGVSYKDPRLQRTDGFGICNSGCEQNEACHKATFDAATEKYCGCCLLYNLTVEDRKNRLKQTEERIHRDIKSMKAIHPFQYQVNQNLKEGVGTWGN